MDRPSGVSSERLEFRFLWDRAEHRRLCRVLQREARVRSRRWLLLNVWFVLLAVISVLGIALSRDTAGAVSAGAPLLIIGAWLVFDRIGIPYWGARAYEHDHAACIPHDQIRIFDSEGITAACKTMNASVRWSGIIKIVETPEFLLFFTTPSCAIQLPRRAIPNDEQLRAWLSRVRQQSNGAADTAASSSDAS